MTVSTIPLLKIEGMKEKEIKFCHLYLMNGNNIGEAAKEAGYKSTINPSKIFALPRVQAYLIQQMSKIEENLNITFDWKVKKLATVIDKSFVRDENGNEVEVKDARAVIGAISELNKMQGHIAPTKQVNINANLDMEPEDFKKLVAEYEREY